MPPISYTRLEREADGSAGDIHARPMSFGQRARAGLAHEDEKGRRAIRKGKNGEAERDTAEENGARHDHVTSSTTWKFQSVCSGGEETWCARGSWLPSQGRAAVPVLERAGNRADRVGAVGNAFAFLTRPAPRQAPGIPPVWTPDRLSQRMSTSSTHPPDAAALS
jgi:hypothetical protein